MFKLYGDETFIEEFGTKKECKEAQKEYKLIEKIMFGRKNINFRIVEE